MTLPLLRLVKATTIPRYVGLGLLAAVAASPEAAAAGKTKGYVISSFMTSVYNDAESCPEGLNDAPDNKDVIARITDPAIREQLYKSQPEDLVHLMTHRGPNWANVCHLEAAVADPDVPAGPLSIPDPGHKLVEGRISYGLDLDGNADGSATETTCAHENFESPTGQKGIDNQLFRVFGCTVGFGPQGWFRIYGQQQMRDGDRTWLVEVVGVEDERNSPDVEVNIYDGADAMIKDPTGDILAGISYNAVSDTRRHAKTRGRIVDGVLTTEPIDVTWLKLRFAGAQIPSTITGARLQLEIQPDGKMKGVLAGYQNWQDIYRLLVHTGANDELPLFFTCPGIYRAFERAADGGRVPGTNSCSAVSVSYDVELVPAHVIVPGRESVAENAPDASASLLKTARN